MKLLKYKTYTFTLKSGQIITARFIETYYADVKDACYWVETAKGDRLINKSEVSGVRQL